MDDKITLLTEEQVENLEVLNEYGRKAIGTDFCCGNENSEYYGASTEYNDTCEKWEKTE